MAGQPRINPLLIITITLGLFIAGRFLGLGPLNNVWSFSHWLYSPIWYPYAWLAGFGAAIAFLVWLLPRTNSTRAFTLSTAVISLLALAAFWLFRFDSFVYGGGNLRIAQLAQAEIVIIRWYEYGTMLVVSGLFHIFKALGFQVLYAAGQAWFALTYVCVIASAAGAYQLARALSTVSSARLAAFVLTFFGAHALLYFGFVGTEVIIPPAVIWFMATALQAISTRSGRSLLVMWICLAVGVLFLCPLAFLFPAAIYVSFAISLPKTSRVPLLVATLSFALLLISVYWRAAHSLEFAQYLLFPHGKLPFVHYGLFSFEHIADWLQIVFLGAPLLCAAVAQLGSPNREGSSHATLAWLATIGGLLCIFILDPAFSPPLDFPRFAAYLTPAGILLALLYIRRSDETGIGTAPAVIGAFAVALPFALLLPYTNLVRAEQYSTPYLESHEPYYRTACIAFRDSYFYHRNWDEAARWDRILPVQSSDYMNLRGTDYLAQNGEYEEALKIQYRIIAKNPFWTEPRSLAATNQMQLGRYDLAKSQIDTCLMIEPYNKLHWQKLYSYYRDVQNYPRAVDAISQAERIAPSDPEILMDKMIINYRTENIATANSLADQLMARDSLLPYPYLIKAFIADQGKNPRGAVQLYEKFMKLAPNEPDVPRVKKRVETLKMALEGR